MTNFLDLTMTLIPTFAICYHLFKLWMAVNADDDIKEIKQVVYITMWMVTMNLNNSLLSAFL